jgi:hypothetical protein
MPTYVRSSGAWLPVSGGSSSGGTDVNSIGSANQVIYKNSINVAVGTNNLTFNGSSLLYTTGNLTINNTSPTIYLQDINHRSSMIHCNSNIFYILRGNGNNSTSWETYNGYWPLEINLENNNAQFGGDVNAIGSIASISDIKVKTNIKTIPNALEKTLQLRGVEFDRIDTKEHQIGVIAQEVEEVIPEVVQDTDGTKSVAYGNLVGVLIEAIKEQNEIITNLKKDVDELKNKCYNKN